MVPGTEVEDVDKDFLYGEFEDGERRKRDRLSPDGWREKLAEKAAFKALDIARDDEEEMEINAPRSTTTTVNGLGVRELMMLGTLGGGVWLLSQFAGREPDSPRPIPPAAVDTDTDTVNRNRLEFAEPI